MHQSPTIQLQHILKFNFIGFIIEIVGVAQDIANGVADLAVNLRELFQYLFGDTNISLVIGGSCPQTNDIGAILGDNFLRGNSIAYRFRHFAAFAVNNVTMRQNCAVRRFAFGSNGSEQ